MSYLRLRFQVSQAQSEALSDLLQDRGALAVTLENAGEDAFYEAAHPNMPSWQQIFATGLFLQDIDDDDIVDAVIAEFDTAIHRQTSSLTDQDWERVCLSDFHQFQAGPGLWVVPSWERPKDPSSVNITIDPGLAFGTGTHPTTALCMDWLARQNLRERTVVDYGCGSGILAISALKLGALRAWGVDIDAKAVAASRGNAHRNDVAGRYVACAPNELPEALHADIVVANILAGVIVELADKLYTLAGVQGTILLTGLLREQQPQVIGAFPTSMSFHSRYRGPWSLLIGKRSRNGRRKMGSK